MCKTTADLSLDTGHLDSYDCGFEGQLGPKAEDRDGVQADLSCTRKGSFCPAARGRSPWELPSVQIPAFGLRHGSYTGALTSSSTVSQEATVHGWYSRQLRLPTRPLLLRLLSKYDFQFTQVRYKNRNFKLLTANSKTLP